MCNHNWIELRGMETARTNDGSFYCMPGYHWCAKCGSLLKRYMPGPYQTPIEEVYVPENINERED